MESRYRPNQPGPWVDAGIRGRPDVGPLEMRTTRVLIPCSLNEGEATLIEDCAHPGEARMETELISGRVAPDLQRLTGRYGKSRPPRRVERVAIRHQHAERVIAAAQIQDDEVARRGALGKRGLAEKSRRGKADAECRDAAAHEFASAVLHTSWYSEDPTMTWRSPGAFTRSCVSAPVHSTPSRRYASRASYAAGSNGAGVSRSR